VDIEDLINSLSKMQKLEGMRQNEIKVYLESLQEQLVKIEAELIYLSQKYGEFKIVQIEVKDSSTS
jgi:hypothetical protein